MSQPLCQRTVSGWIFTWPDLPITLTIQRVRESSKGIIGELEIVVTEATGSRRTIAHQALSLLTSKARLAADLTRRFAAPWASLLEQVSILVLRDLRRGHPVESLAPTETTAVTPFVLNPLLYERNLTVLYAPGDSLKSFFVLYCALLLASGVSEHGLYCAPEPWPVLYLDYEMSAEDLRARVRLLQRGHPQLCHAPDYRRCVAPLADDLEPLKALISERGYRILILDSLAMAAGGADLDKAEAAIRFMAALRALDCTTLAIGHTPKPHPDDQGRRSIYGSVFFYNLCRSAWEVRRDEEIIGLYQTKNNLGRRSAPLGFRLQVDHDACVVEPADLHAVPSLAAALPLQDRLVHLLRTTGPCTLERLAEQLEESPRTIEAQLRRAPTLFLECDGRWSLLSS